MKNLDKLFGQRYNKAEIRQIGRTTNFLYYNIQALGDGCMRREQAASDRAIYPVNSYDGN